MSADAHHLTAPPEDGDGVARVMAAALEDAGLAPATFSTSTRTPRRRRWATGRKRVAIDRVFGAHAARLAVSSTKSMTGHLLGGAGALEAGLTVLALRDQMAPPTINLDAPGRRQSRSTSCRTSARRIEIAHAMTNSFGFGGTNASLIFKRAGE